MLFSFTHGNLIFVTSNLGASMMLPALMMPSTMMEGIIDSNLTLVLSNNTPNPTLCARVQETPEMTIGVIKHCNLQGKMINGASKCAELPNSATNRPGPTNPDDLTEALELFTLDSRSLNITLTASSSTADQGPHDELAWLRQENEFLKMKMEGLVSFPFILVHKDTIRDHHHPCSS
ncbi:hypothetical protein EV421DRAFT_1901269 [Armillaria borealis]|uniref:Uncharacterized protein n=1 Tax=Armillaria borealis TaxID=47425 RepID=A0AA39MUJ2_9AGAR|nr:hypothetical protein EV421DRAFT_1901269 [Armillaria borealis]